MYLKSSVVLVFVAVFIAFTAVILNKDKIFWPRNLWARHNSATYGFSFRYPPNLTVLDQDPKTSSINNSALYLELVDSETHFGSVDIIPVRQQVRFKGFKESVPIKDGDEELIIGGKTVHKEIYLDNARLNVTKYASDIYFSYNNSYKLKFVVDINIYDTPEQVARKEKVFEEMVGSISFNGLN